jgi:hypothetical protein
VNARDRLAPCQYSLLVSSVMSDFSSRRAELSAYPVRIQCFVLFRL